jgi:hypothetical protein
MRTSVPITSLCPYQPKAASPQWFLPRPFKFDLLPADLKPRQEF